MTPRIALLLLMGAWAAQAGVRYADVTGAAGLRFVHQSGAQGQRYLPETYGPGLAFLDYDLDGRLDLYLVNGGRLPGLSNAPLAYNALYRNLGDGTFAQVEGAAGAADSGYGMGAAVGDIDNDGDGDLYVTNFGPNVLYRNDGGRLTDITGRAGVGDEGWGSSAAFADFDLDGDLDLFAGNYLDYPRRDPLVCYIGNTQERLYCDPRKFPGQLDRLYRNDGDRFADITAEAGLASTAGKELGVVWGDFDADGDPDLYLANDMAPNMLYRNDGGRFAERGLASGTSLSDEGVVQAGMGVDAGDADGDGDLDLFVTNFQWENNALYRNLGNFFFADASVESDLHRISLAFLGFGTGFLDYDLDGDLDLFVANGHVYDNVDRVDRAASHAQRNQLLENQGGGRFAQVDEAGEGLARVEVSRGAAFADWDDDGDVDIAVSNCNGPAALLRNEGGTGRHWLGLRLRGVRANRDGVGARVLLTASGRTQVREVHGGYSYLSAHDLRLLFGLGEAPAAERLEIRWPGGGTQILEGVAGDRYVEIEEMRAR